MERAGTLSIPYGKQAAFAGRLGLTGDVRSFRIKNAGAPFRSHQRLIGQNKNADRSPSEAIGA